MSDFISQVQCEELVDYRPTEEDMSDYADYLDSIDDDATPKEAELYHLLMDDLITPEEFEQMIR